MHLKHCQDINKCYEELTVDTSMSTVGPTPLLLGLVHLDVRYVESINIQTFNL
jgi:hypothetical protein